MLTTRRQLLYTLILICFIIFSFACSCNDIDMSTPRNTVEGYIAAQEKLDYSKMSKYRGEKGEDIYLPRGNQVDLDFRNLCVVVTSATETEATVDATWEIWATVEDISLPVAGAHYEYELVKWNDKWIISYITNLAP